MTAKVNRRSLRVVKLLLRVGPKPIPMENSKAENSKAENNKVASNKEM